MKIGFDIDNVVTMFDEMLFKLMLKEDKKKRNKGIVNCNADYITHGMFDWTKEECDSFLNQNVERFAERLKVKPNAKKIINRLIDEGHEVYFISHRAAPHYKNPFETTKKWFDKHNIKYTKIIISKDINKSKECKNLKVDMLFDDTIKGCLPMIESGVKCIIFETKFNKDKIKNYEHVSNWNEIYEKIQNETKQKVVFDTDLANETDDEFALAYLLNSLNKIDLQAITLAPFIHRNEIGKLTLADNQQKNIISAKKILKFCKKTNFNKIVHKGSNEYFDNAKTTCEAVEKIIEIARKNVKTTIIAVGTLTNVALAIKQAPDIIPKIKVLWLGGNSFLYDNNEEYNFRQDKSAVKRVFKSNVNLTVFPCRNVASNLMTTKEELELHINQKENILGQYLLKGYLDFCQRKGWKLPSHELFDISLVAYIVNKNWFKEKAISCPKILGNGSYKQTKFRHKVNYIYDLDRNEIFYDLYKKLGNV